MKNIEILLNEVNQLKALLEDPHPGLFTWWEAYHRRLGNVSEWYTGDSKKEQDKCYCAPSQGGQD